jgi:CheY-like chemotaxis protein
MSHAQPSVLIVDDERVNIDVMVELLLPHYRTLVATNGAGGEARLRRAAARPAAPGRDPLRASAVSVPTD